MGRSFYIRTMRAGRLVKAVRYQRALPRDTRRARAAKTQHTSRAQRYINLKNGAGRLEALFYANFDTPKACFVTWTYGDEALPKSVRDAKANIKASLGVIRTEKKARGEAFPYIYNTEGVPVSAATADVCGNAWEITPWKCLEKWETVGDKDRETLSDETRLHHHGVMVLDKRDYETIRAHWPYGRVYINRIDIKAANLFETLAYYMTKDARAGRTGNGQRSYIPSKGLIQPTIFGEWVDSYQDIQPPKGSITLYESREETLYSSYHAATFLFPKEPPREYERPRRAARKNN